MYPQFMYLMEQLNELLKLTRQKYTLGKIIMAENKYIEGLEIMKEQ